MSTSNTPTASKEIQVLNAKYNKLSKKYFALDKKQANHFDNEEMIMLIHGKMDALQAQMCELSGKMEELEG